MIWCVAVIFAVLMLKLGGLARQRLEVLRRFHIPASIIAGLIAWFMIRLFGVLEKLATGQSSYAQALFEFLNQWPGWLIALVFAGMLLQPSRSRSSSGRLSRVGREGLMAVSYTHLTLPTNREV